MLSQNLIYLISLVTAFVGVIMELAFAQLLTIIFGGTNFLYSLTIGIFTLTLGLGSIISDKVNPNIRLKLLINFQYILIAIVMASPLVLITISYKNIIMSFLPIFFIGLLTGFELPILISMSRKNENIVIAFDYFGMFIASVAFGTLLLPYLGIFKLIYGTTMLSFLVTIILYLVKKDISIRDSCILFFLIIMFILI